MQAAHLEEIMRRLGQIFIVAMVFQLRVAGRPVLLPLVAVVATLSLRELRPLAGSPEAQRAWLATIGCAIGVAVLSVIAWIPAIPPGDSSVVVAIVFNVGMISYASLLTIWSLRADWADARRYLTRARLWLSIDLVLIAFGVVLLIGFGTQLDPNGPDADSATAVFGRNPDGAAVWVWFIAFSIAWLISIISLQIASKTIRKALRAQPTSIIPSA